MKLIDRIATQKKTSEPEKPASDSADRPRDCICESPSPRWRKIDGQIFCLICTPPTVPALVAEILHVTQNAKAQSGNMASGSGFSAALEDDLPPYEPLERSVPWSHPSIVRSIYEGYGLLQKSDPRQIDEDCAGSDSARRDDTGVAWDAELASWALSLAQDQLPAEPWRPHPWSIITSNAKYLAYLQTDVRRGRDGPRAKTGALQKQLRELRLLIDQ